MLSRTSQYALQAVVCLARHADDWPIPGRQIAAETGVPRRYLASLLSDLVRAGVLDASPGMGGGFRIVRRPQDVRLNEVLAPFEPVLALHRPCPFGKAVCSDDDPCAGHERWKRVREVYTEFLRETSVYDVSVNEEPVACHAVRKSKRE